MIDENDFNDMIEPENESGAAKKPAIGIAVHAPAINSVELAILETSYLDPLLKHDAIFIEADEVEAETSLPDDPDLARVLSSIARDYQLHISLSRSLGQKGTWSEYRELCRLNGMSPIWHRDDIGVKNEQANRT